MGDEQGKNGKPIAQLAPNTRKKMMVGMNYSVAWNAFGSYFGGGDPHPGTMPQMDLWLPNLRTNLIHLRDKLKMTHVRIFLLCNGNNYCTIENGHVKLPAVFHQKFRDHFDEMLKIFAEERMKVIPVLIDFMAFGKAGFGGCKGYFEIANNPTLRQRFFMQTLQALLDASKKHRDTNNGSPIYAWEVMNEPYHNCPNIWGLYHYTGEPTIEIPVMNNFLKEGTDLIEAAGFPSTIGHRFYSDLGKFGTGTMRQFHYYPIPEPHTGIIVADNSIPPYSESKAFVGEFGAPGRGADGKYEIGNPWPELLGRDDHDTRSRVRERLYFLELKGYPLVLVWPDIRGKSVAPVDPIKLSAECQEGIIDYQTDRMGVPEPPDPFAWLKGGIFKH